MTTFDPSGLRAEIARSGLTARQVAAKAKVSESFIYNASSGKGNPKLSSLQRVADAVGCDVRAFFLPGPSHKADEPTEAA